MSDSLLAAAVSNSTGASLAPPIVSKRRSSLFVHLSDMESKMIKVFLPNDEFVELNLPRLATAEYIKQVACTAFKIDPASHEYFSLWAISGVPNLLGT